MDHVQVFFLYFTKKIGQCTVQIVSHEPGVSATLVKPVIGRASTPLELHEFSQVSFDKFGYPQPLPPGLGGLQLYPDNDGFFSVNGPLDLTVLSPHAAPALVNTDSHFSILPLITGIPGFSGPLVKSPRSFQTMTRTTWMVMSSAGLFLLDFSTPLMTHPSRMVFVLGCKEVLLLP